MRDVNRESLKSQKIIINYHSEPVTIELRQLQVVGKVLDKQNNIICSFANCKRLVWVLISIVYL